MSDPWEDAMIEKPTIKATVAAPKTTQLNVGMVWTAGGYRPAEPSAPTARSALPQPVTKTSAPVKDSFTVPAGVSSSFARSMASLNGKIAHETAMDSHGARDAGAEADAARWSGVAKQLKEQEKQDKMAKFNGYVARGGGYVRR